MKLQSQLLYDNSNTMITNNINPQMAVFIRNPSCKQTKTLMNLKLLTFEY